MPVIWLKILQTLHHIYNLNLLLRQRRNKRNTNDSISCVENCNDALGMADGRIKDAQIFASSSADETQMPFFARVNQTVQGSRGGWCSAFPDNTEFLEIDLKRKFTITGNYK